MMTPRTVRWWGGAVLAVGLVLWAGGCGQSAKPGGEKSVEKEEHPELKAFLESYFKTWSDQDMVAYKAHFDPAAVVMYVSDGEVKSSKRLEPFISSQVEVHRTGKMVETMERFEAQVDRKAASATVWWVLVKGEGTRKTGVDRFTLIRTESGWSIVALVFYQD